ncbi:hypothetical protein [Roseateles sp. PN1]|uniref:hypothetical protein n=1 Tax=Roseateles sp. PN1 TaxID=3137372 RepID=UPI00313A1740
MSEIVVVVNRFDLPIAATLLSQRDAQVLVADPLLQNHAQAQGMAAPLLEPGLDAHAYLRAFRQAEQAALQLNRALAPLLEHWAPNAAAAAWSSHRTLQMFSTLFCYRDIWKHVVPAHAQRSWHVLLPSNPHDYGVHSFLPGLTLVDALQAAGISHTAYGYDCPGADAFVLPDLRQLPAEMDLLCHLPTCFHDAAYFGEELHASGLRCGILSSQRYDVALPGHTATGLIDLATVAAELGAEGRARIDALEVEIKEVLLSHLRPHILQRSFLLKQIDSLWEVLALQGLFYLWLEQRLGAKPPAQLLISNHDATVHGALMSFAQNHGMKITVIPHSRVHNSLLKTDGLKPVCLHHGMQDGPVLDLSERVLPSRRLSYPGAWQAPQVLAQVEAKPFQTLGLILNGISGNGVCVVDFDQYIADIDHIRSWAKARGIQFKLRVRAAETPIGLVGERLNIPAQELLQHAQGSLLDFARGCDVCVGYDSPTSGLQDLIREGVPSLQIDRRPLSRLEWSIIDARIVPRYAMSEGLERLGFMHANPAEFQAFAQRQHEAGLASQLGAQPLRHWLLAN